MAAFPNTSRFIDVTQSLCDAKTCFAAADGVVNYFDDNHLSAKLSRRLKDYFFPSIREVTAAAARQNATGPEQTSPSTSMASRTASDASADGGTDITTEGAAG